MDKDLAVAISLAVMVVAIVGADFAFLRNNFRLRLVVNIAIVALFIVFYFAVLRRL